MGNTHRCKGVYAVRENTRIKVKDMKKYRVWVCLEGEYDDIPEQAFYMVGTIEDVLEKARAQEAVGV